jgi:hypothetical protein
MKNLIYQYYSSPDKDRVKKDRPGVYINAGNYHEYSKQSISAYAKKHGVLYKFMDHKLPDDIPLFYGIFLPFLEGWCWDYDNICFIDSDIMATVNSGNVFDYAGKQGLTLHKMDASKHRFDSKRAFKFFNEINGFFNSGVVIFPRSEYENFIHFASTLKQRDLNRTSVENSLGGFDQGLLNTWIANHKRYNELPKQYNYHMGRYQKPERWYDGVSLIHYHREDKALMEPEFQDERILK